MKALGILLLITLLTSCSNAPVKRTIATDKSLRVMVDPKSAGNDYTKVVSALVQSGSFRVIDRKAAYRAIREEQNRLHRHSSDRFADNQKFAHWGRLYGVGAVVVARSQCWWHRSYWAPAKLWNRCELFLSLVDSNSGEIIVSVRDENDSPQGSQPNWEDAVRKLSETYPKHFTSEKIHKRLQQYMDESKKNATTVKKIRQRKVILPHDDNFDAAGNLLSADEVLEKVKGQR